MGDEARVRRFAERIRELVTAALRTQIKDPRVGMVTVTDTRLTGDLRDATIYYTVLGDVGERASTAAALASANGLLRSLVGKRLGLRHAPTLTFVADEMSEHVQHIDELLSTARQADDLVQQQAVRARPAGDSHPYRQGTD